MLALREWSCVNMFLAKPIVIRALSNRNFKYGIRDSRVTLN